MALKSGNVRARSEDYLGFSRLLMGMSLMQTYQLFAQTKEYGLSSLKVEVSESIKDSLISSLIHTCIQHVVNTCGCALLILVSRLFDLEHNEMLQIKQYVPRLLVQVLNYEVAHYPFEKWFVRSRSGFSKSSLNVFIE